MSERYIGDSENSHDPIEYDENLERVVEAGIKGLLEEADIQISQPQGRDPHIQGFAYALSDILSPHRNNNEILNFQSDIKEAFKTRLKNGRSLIPWVDLNILRLAFQKQVMLEQDKLPQSEWKYSSEQYPWSDPDKVWTIRGIFEYSELWQQAFRNILSDKGEIKDPRRKGLGAESLFKDIANKDVSTTKPSRYRSAQYVLSKLSEQNKLPTLPRILDIGSGPFGLKVLADPFHNFRKVKIIKKYSRDELYKLSPTELPAVHEQPEDILLSESVNNHLDTAMPLGNCFGIDRVSFEDEEMKNWSRFSHYAKELEEPATLLEYDRLDRLKLRNVNFLTADITKEKPRKLEKYKCDVVMLITVLDLLNALERKNLMEAGRSYLDPEGPQIMTIADFAVEDPNEESGLRFLEHMTIEPFPYRVFVIDFKEPNPKPKTWMAWTGGRCEKGVIVED
jgi:hypothetical protein